MEKTVGSDLRVGADGHAGVEHRSRSDARARADGDVGAEPDLGADLGTGVDGRGRMHERTARTLRFERGEQRSERDPRRLDGQDRLPIGRGRIDQRGVGQDGAGTRFECRPQVAFVDGEGQGAGIGLIDRRDAFDRQVRIAENPAARLRSEVRQRPERAAHGVGVAFSTICKIFSTSGVMSTPP